MYLFAPLDKHFDKGFGAVADSFQDAAVALKETYNSGTIFTMIFAIDRPLFAR